MVIANKKKNSEPGTFYQLLRSTDFLQLIPVLLLLAIGTAFIYSTGQQVGTHRAESFWKLQLLWIAIGFGIWLIMSLIDYRLLRHWCWLFYAIGIILLVAVFIFGVERYGAKRWLHIYRIRMQPSEFAKIATLLAVAWVMSLKGFKVNKLSSLLLLALVAGIPFILIVKEPDLGSAIILAPICACMLFVAGLKWQWIVTAIIMILLLIPLSYPFLPEYQKMRIHTFLHPEDDPKKRGWNRLQAELAVGSGGMWGKGYMQGTQNTLGFLPQTVSNTDFIFSVIAEETGFAGSATIILLYFLLTVSACRTAWIACDKFGRYIAIGIAGLLFTHSFVNIGMSIGLTPITGLPLPLVSYGGSFVVNIMLCMGILQSIYARGQQAKLNSSS